MAEVVRKEAYDGGTARCLIDDVFGRNWDSVKITRIRRDLARGRREEARNLRRTFFDAFFSSTTAFPRNHHIVS